MVCPRPILHSLLATTLSLYSLRVTVSKLPLLPYLVLKEYSYIRWTHSRPIGRQNIFLLRLCRIYLLPWDTYSWVIFCCCFRRLSVKMYCSELALLLLYIPEYFLVRVYIDVFHDIIFSYALTTTWTLTFGYIKCISYVAFNDSFLNIVFGQYFRQ